MDAPDAFVEFVAEHEPDVRAAARDVTGSESTVRHLAVAAFAAVAARWEWLHPQGRWARLRRPGRSPRWPRSLRTDPEAARRVLYRAVHRMGTDWRDELPVDTGLEWEVLGSDHQRYGPGPSLPAGSEGIAVDAWDEGLRLRRRRAIVARGSAAGLALFLLLIPRAGQEPYLVPDRGPQFAAPSLPADIPPNVALLPTSAELPHLDRRPAPLPAAITADPATARPFTEAPIPSVAAVIRDSTEAMTLVAPDGQIRRVDRADLGDGKLLNTSVSPDGARVVLIDDPFLTVVNPGAGTVHRIRAPVDAQPAQPRLIWRDGRTVLVPGAVGATVIDVDSGTTTYETSVNVLHLISPQGPARQAYTTELVPLDGDSSSGQLRIRRTKPTGTPGPDGTGRVEVVPLSAPTWMGQWIGQGWGNGRLYIRPCDSRSLLLPYDVGVAQDPIGVVEHRGLAVRTLVTVEQGVTMEILGWLSPTEALIRASRDRWSWLIAWAPAADSVTLVSQVTGRGRIAVADLYRP